MRRGNFCTIGNAARAVGQALIGIAAVWAMPDIAAAATALPTPPQTFDTTYTAPAGATLTIGAGGDLQAALDKAQLGDTIVLQAGATFTGPYTLPNKTSGSGWIYIISSNLASLPIPGQRVSPNDAANMAKLVAPAYNNALTTVANSHHFRFVGVEFTVAAGARVYQVITIGNKDTSTATLAHHIIFDRCYVHGDPTANDRRGIEMDGAYVAVVDSYISDFQEQGADSQGLLAYNTSGPLQIRNNYIEGAGENVMFGGATTLNAALIPADIEISNNYFFKPLSLITSKYVVKNQLEFKAALRVLVTGNIFENNPAKSQNGLAILITPRTVPGNSVSSGTSDITITNNRLINVSSGFNLSGHDTNATSQLTERVLIRNNVIGITGLNAAGARGFVFTNGGKDFTIDHNTIINTATTSDLGVADTASSKVAGLVFTNNLSTQTTYGFFGSGAGEGSAALNADFANWAFSRNVLVAAPAASYPTGNFFPSTLAAVHFVNYAGGDYTLNADSPYKSAATDGTDIGANMSTVPALPANYPNPPSDVTVR